LPYEFRCGGLDAAGPSVYVMRLSPTAERK
jgi:hypothetical protein